MYIVSDYSNYTLFIIIVMHISQLMQFNGLLNGYIDCPLMAYSANMIP